MTKRKVLLLLLALLLAAGAWWAWNSRQENNKNLPPVKADQRILSEGIIYPVRYAQMVMPVDGMVGEILTAEGDRVKAGQPLIRLVRQDYEARVGSARSDVARAAVPRPVGREVAGVATVEGPRGEPVG